jgi:hypothetical protein
VNMGNRRLTLAYPSFSISPWSSKRSLSKYPGSVRAEARSNSRRELEFQSKFPSMISAHDHVEWMEMDLEDWLSSDRFPPLSSKKKTPAVAFGLLKHSQMSNTDRVERLHHCNLPPIAAVGTSMVL